MKKTITLTVLSAMMALSLTSTVFAKSTFSDVPVTHWANATVEKAVSARLINGYEDNTFKPENTMSKLEFLSVVGKDLARTYGTINDYLTRDFAPGCDENKFLEKFNPPEWAKHYIKWAYNAHIITENDTEFFNYNEPITRAEIAKILRRVEISDEWLDEVAKKTGYGKPDGIRAAYRDYLVKEYRDNTSEEQLEKDYTNWNECSRIDNMMYDRPDLYKDIRTACAYYHANMYTGQYTSWEKNAYKWLAEWNLEQITLRMNETLETKPVEANAIADWNAIADENKPAVASVYKAKIVNGYEDGTFKPNNTVTRAEAATMLINAYEYLPKNKYHGGAY